jgi:hypothetical protein
MIGSSDHEIVLPKLSIFGLPQVEEECLVKEPVPGISTFPWEIELRGKEAPSRSLDLEMKMTCSSGIKRRDDSVEPPASLNIGELMPPKSEADGIVVTFLVRMPDLDEATGDWPAAIVENESRNDDALTPGRIGIKIAFQRGVRPEEGSSLPFEGQIVPSMT